MKKKILLTLLGFACLTLGACGATPTDVTSLENVLHLEASSVEMQNPEINASKESTEKSTDEASETEEGSIDEAVETEEGKTDNALESEEDYGEDPSLRQEDDFYLNLKAIYYPNPSFRFYLSLDQFTENQWPEGTCSFYVGDRLIAAYDHLDLTTPDKQYCFEMDGKEFGNTDTFTVVIASEGKELTRAYSFNPGEINVYGVTLDGEKGELSSCLAGGVYEYIDSFVDKQGTDEVYSELIITRNIPDSHLVSEAAYSVEIGLYRLTTLRGTGIMDGDVLHFISNENEIQVCGDITFGEYEEGATFTVTKSDFGYLSVGQSFEFNDFY